MNLSKHFQRLNECVFISSETMHYYFPTHYNGGNRGCEGIAKGSAVLLASQPSDIIARCTDTEQDIKLGLRNSVTLYNAKDLSFFQKVKRRVLFSLIHSSEKRRWMLIKYDYINFLNQLKIGDVMISSGGDMMCYDNNEVILTNNYTHARGIKTVLWGCSMGPENLTPEKEKSLRDFSLIYARDSLTYEFFRSLDLKNVCLFPDPAFVLEPEECELPFCFSNHRVIGLNLSNYVLGDFSLDTPFGHEVIRLMDYLLNETDLHVLLIPHVTWEGQDDRVVANMLAQRYTNRARVSVLDIENLNYCQIRYIISNCELFIGGRTHAVISAYSTCVPTLAIGYSVKSKGIAKDLGLPDNLVVDSKKCSEGLLYSAFRQMEKNSSGLQSHLHSVIPEYRKRAFGVLKEVRKLLA